MKYRQLRSLIKVNNRIAGGLLAFVIFVGIVWGLDCMYLAPQDQEWERILWHHFYEDKGKIDNLYIGSSHVYLGINPYILDDLNGQYNFNLASTAQPMNGTYYLLREAQRYNDIKHVYVDLFYTEMVKNNFDSDSETIDTEIYRNWQNTDYMKWSVNKLSYMFSIAGPDKYTDIFLPFCRYRKYVNNSYYVHTNLERKKEEEYRGYQYHSDFDDGNGYDEYQKQGYFKSTREFLDIQKLYPQYRVLGECPIGVKAEGYLRKIIEFCQKEDIPVTLFVTPMDNLQLISTEDYDNYVEQVNEIAAEYDVPFYDFNLAKEEYLPIQQGEYFRDVGHLNDTGAKIFTPFFSEVVSGDEAQNETYFHHSYAEKLQAEAPAVYGIYCRDVEEIDVASGQVRKMWIASNRAEGMEYRITLTPDEGEQRLVQDFDTNKEFMVSVEEGHGICTITARMQDSQEKVQTMDIWY